MGVGYEINNDRRLMMNSNNGRHRFRSPIRGDDGKWLADLVEELILVASRTKERSNGQVSGFAQDYCEDIMDMLIDIKVDIQEELKNGKS